MGPKRLRTWSLTIDLDLLFSDLVALDDRVTTKVDGFLNQASSAIFWPTKENTYPETNEYHFAVRLKTDKIMSAKLTSAIFCGSY